MDNWFSTIQNSEYVTVTVRTKSFEADVTLNWVFTCDAQRRLSCAAVFGPSSIFGLVHHPLTELPFSLGFLPSLNWTLVPFILWFAPFSEGFLTLSADPQSRQEVL